MQIGFVLSLIFAILIATFAIKNGESVSIDLFFTTKQVSQAIVILISAAFGAVIVTILGLVRQIRLSLRIKEQKKKIKTLEEQNNEYKIRLGEEDEFNETQLKQEQDLDLDDVIEQEIEKSENETTISEENDSKKEEINK